MKQAIQRTLALSTAALVLAGCATQSGMNEREQNAQITEAMTAPSAGGEAPALPQAARERLTPEPLASDASTNVSEPRFNLSADDAQVANVYHSLVDGTPYNVVVHPDVTGRVSFDLKDVSVPGVMEVLRKGYGYHYQRTAESFLVLPSGLETRVFSLDYINVDRNGVSGTRVSGGEIESAEESDEGNEGGQADGDNSIQSDTSSLRTESESQLWQEVASAVEQIIGAESADAEDTEEGGNGSEASDGAHVVTSPSSGRVVVRAEPEALNQVESFISALQEAVNRQVILEARIVEVTLDEQFESGIDWSYVGETDGAETSIDLTPTGTDIASGVFDLGIIRDGSFSATINALDEQGDVMVLSAPRVSTLNNQKALIKVGTDSFFQTGVELDTTITDGTSQTTINPEFRSFFSGISLDVTPNISSDDEVTLHVRPSVSEVTETPRTVQTGSSGEVSFQLASSDVRQSDSIVRASDGELVVIGGLMKRQNAQTDAAVPVIGEGGPLAPLFSRNERSMEKVELAILLRPTIVGEKTWSQTIETQLEGML